MITLNYLQETAERNVEIENRLEHIIDIMTDCGVADFVPTDVISHWQYAPECSCVIAEKEYKDHYDGIDQWESYSIPVECLEMSDEELQNVFEEEAEVKADIEHRRAIEQLKRDAKWLGYDIVLNKENKGNTFGSPETEEDAKDWVIAMTDEGW